MNRELQWGSILSYLIIVINIVVGLGYTPVMLRCLGQEQFGLYSLAASIISYLTVLDLGFGNAIIRYFSKYRAEGRSSEQANLLGMFYRVYGIIGLVVLCLGSILCLNVTSLFHRTMSAEETQILTTICWLLVGNLVLTFTFSIYSSVISASEKFIFQKLIVLARIILNPLVMIVFLMYGYKAITMVVVTSLFNFMTLLINFWYCRYKLKVRFAFNKFDWALFKEVSAYSVWVFLNVIMDRIYWSTGQFVLGVYLSAQAVAIYALAIQIKTIYFHFSTAINGVLLPRITSIVSSDTDGEQRISNIFIRVGRIQFAVVFLILSGFALFGREFVHLWAGEGYSEVYPICLLIMIPTTIPLIQNVGITILQARNQMKFRSILYVFIAILSVFASIWLCQIYGGLGCAIATAVAILLGHGLIMNIYYRRKQKIDIFAFWVNISKMGLPLCILTSLFYGGLIFLPTSGPLSLICYAVVFTVFYGLTFWLFSSNSEERALILNIKRKLIK